ncbi:hypothetical protein [Dendronalium sp. ChiSLP03b]|nr:hypothetical protein [Dendronalium sp. ChiSLP03b]MDZ8206178.1 hypothetical protein [Dendronalium sp. ChiSLP03b]
MEQAQAGYLEFTRFNFSYGGDRTLSLLKLRILGERSPIRC